MGTVLLVGLYLREYVRRKAQNLASKEDLAALTEQVERVKSSYRVQEELLRADLQRKARIHQAQMDLELEIYRDLWAGASAMDVALAQVQAYGLAAHPKVTEARKTFEAARTKIEELQKQSEPFIAREVLAALMELQINMRLIALKSTDGSRTTEAAKTDAIKEWVKTLGDCRRKLRVAISDRLFGDEAGGEAAVGSEADAGKVRPAAGEDRALQQGEGDGATTSDEPNGK
jgi:hypothetical protein